MSFAAFASDIFGLTYDAQWWRRGRLYHGLLRDRDKLPCVLPDHRLVAHVLTCSADANDGVDEIVEEQRPFAIKHGVSFGDL